MSHLIDEGFDTTIENLRRSVGESSLGKEGTAYPKSAQIILRSGKTLSSTEPKLDYAKEIQGTKNDRTLSSLDVESVSTKKTKEPKRKMPDDYQMRLSMIRAIDAIPIFNGEQNENSAQKLDGFLDYAINIYNALKIGEKDELEQAFVDALLTRLSGETRLAAKHRKLKTFKAFKEYLENRHLPIVALPVLIHKMNNFAQDSKESTREYAGRLQYLLDQTLCAVKQNYKGKDTESLESELQGQAITTFKVGLISKDLRSGINLQKTKSLDELVEKAVELESLLLMTDQRILLRCAADTALTEKSVEDRAQKLEKISCTTARSSQNSKCLFCNRKGHSIEECRVKRNTPFCSGCDQYGHTLDNCSRNGTNRVYANSYRGNNYGNPNSMYSRSVGNNYQTPNHNQYEGRERQQYFQQYNQTPQGYNQPRYPQIEYPKPNAQRQLIPISNNKQNEYRNKTPNHQRNPITQNPNNNNRVQISEVTQQEIPPDYTGSYSHQMQPEYTGNFSQETRHEYMGNY